SAAHVKSDNAIEPSKPCDMKRAHYSTCGPREDRPDRLASSSRRRNDAPGGLHDLQAAAFELGRELLLQSANVAAHLRSEIRIDQHGRSAFVFAKLGQDLMRNGNWHAELRKGFCNRPLILRICECE